MKIINFFLLIIIVSCNTNPLGSESSVGNTFHPGLQDGPKIHSISPNQGSLLGGTNVTLTGTGFSPLMLVKVGGLSCGQITYQSPRSIVCLTPPHAIGSTDFLVQNPDKQSHRLENIFNYVTNIPTATGFGISSGGKKSSSATLSMETTIGESYSGEVMVGPTTQLRVGTQGILFSP